MKRALRARGGQSESACPTPSNNAIRRRAVCLGDLGDLIVEEFSFARADGVEEVLKVLPVQVDAVAAARWIARVF